MHRLLTWPFFFFIIVLLSASYIVFNHLGTPPLEHWDEGFYASAVKEMINRNNYIVLYFNNEIFLEKPPFQMWMTVVFANIFGLSEWTIRLPSALSAVTIIAIITWYTYKKWGWLPALFAVATLALNDVFVWRSRTGNLDILSTLYFVLIFFVIQWKDRLRYPVLGVLFGLLYLTKLGLVVFPIGYFVLYEIIYNRSTLLSNWRSYILVGLISLVLPLIWLGIGTYSVGSSFWESYIINADQNVGNSNTSYLGMDYIMYAYYSLQRHFFWFFLLGLVFLFINIRNGRNFLLILFSVVLIIVLSFVERSNNWYLVPSMPFWSITIAYAVYHILRIAKIVQERAVANIPQVSQYIKMFEKRFSKLAPLFVILTSVVLLLFVSYKIYKTYTVNITPRFSTYSTIEEQYSAIYIKENSLEDEVLVRLDHLYPATIYYVERYVIVAPLMSQENMQDIYDNLQKYSIKWFAGKEEDITHARESLDNRGVTYEVIETPYDEIILRVD